MPSVDPTSHCNRSCRLTEVEQGGSGIVERLELESNERMRLLRLGLAPGRTLTLLKRGSRCLVAVAGARLAIDRALAKHVYVVPSHEFV